MGIYEELKARGLIAQVTDEEEIRQLINNGGARFYIGFDPTADSLHIGHYIPIMAMAWMQKYGHRPIALFGGGLYIFIAEFNNPATLGDLPLGDKILAALFQSMTTRSAGFSTIDNGALTAGGYLASNILMVIGVAPASTGGGIKLATLVVLLASIKTTVSGGDEYSVAKRSINKKTFNKAVAILLVYILAICGALAVISLTDNQFTLEQLLFECISALSNVGLTTGITWDLSAAAQLVLIVLMYFGRAGFLCVVYSLVGSNKVNIRYPDSKIVIG